MRAAAALDPRLKVEQWSDPHWRLNHLYHVIDDDGHDYLFRMRPEQEELYANLWHLNVILKARQLGFTTFIELLALDQCIWNANFTAAVVCDTRENAEKIFRTKVLHPYMQLPEEIRRACPLVKQTGSELVFKNGSSISVSTSARGTTVHLLHVSEMGKIARKFPEKAREIVTGSFEAAATGMIFVESTAEGNAGQFYDICIAALKRAQAKAKQTRLDFRLHFFPWWRKPGNRLDPAGVIISDEHKRYFKEIRAKHGIELDAAQRAWYVKKCETLDRDMKREHPSFPEEAFAQAIDGAVYATQMAVLRRLGRVGMVPVRPQAAVNTFWDLGLRDTNFIWLHQRVGVADRFFKVIYGTGHGMGYYWKELEEVRRELDFVWGVHHLPHDGKQRIQHIDVTTRQQLLEELIANTPGAGGKVVSVDRTTDISIAIEETRRRMSDAYIDEEGCGEGIRGLDNYQYEWIESSGTWSHQPLHNWASNPADAFRTWSQGYRPEGAMLVRPQQQGHYPRGSY